MPCTDNDPLSDPGELSRVARDTTLARGSQLTGGKAPEGSKSKHRNRRRGSGASKSAESISLFYGNVTSMSKKAELYLSSLADAMWLAGESHIRHEDIGSWVSKWCKNWVITAAPAIPSQTSETGTYGGVIAATRKHIASECIADDQPQTAWTLAADRDLAGRTLHLRGVDVLVLGGYARDGEYQEMATAIARITRNGTLPFIWLADFNAPPCQLRDGPWLARLDACVIVPDVQITCHAGSGSLIDYCVCSRVLIPYIVSFESVGDVPWAHTTDYDYASSALRKPSWSELYCNLVLWPRRHACKRTQHQCNWLGPMLLLLLSA